MADNTPTLRQRLESLPQELYDEIYTLTFTAAPGERKICAPTKSESRASTLSPDISRCFRGHDSANLFLVDRASSQMFAESYFGGEGAVFTFHCDMCWTSWLSRLNDEHRRILPSLW
ncbi:hypothetical protein CLAFUW4_11769 [Fulvia fulva]|uniref:Uncharacterized protein n=1 Tax=Passalora fulva TaxID=5499 RepID=A0A9Q8USB1_PASFU|nr:uncharacterized protein CLAFUR5_10813 [Fulvia fulva]KAK4617930.1 hypothetical protein CLAFUR4_11774 [Fulvia fulva]KAK4619163.1 hypothetical protein CLAFUR0_11787 [Fulvia fulva]UJO20591.1 hypothetical protein CLAFUR5_10813 [Fulvia fulva]WPV18500.1 hypothetical protein CLAFUW4_11769 [Fulvia fulva]WPV33281.1 hypothetical protein CLAFUW7_11776 [Fulvia fulva]